MRKNPAIVVLLVLFSLLWAVNGASAENTPGYTLAGSLVYFNESDPLNAPLSSFGSVALANSRGSFELTAQGMPFPSLLATASSHDGNYVSGKAEGVFDYFFQILGPDGPVDVLLDAKGGISGDAAGQTNEYASASARSLWKLSMGSTPITGNELYKYIGTYSSDAFAETLNDSILLTLNTNRVYTVHMEAMAQSLVYADTANATAWIDPYFQLALDVDPRVYSFDFSSGVGNTPAPEPSVLLLLGSGIAALASFGWKRNRQ